MWHSRLAVYEGSGSSLVPHLTLYTKPGCHLCDEARARLDETLTALDAFARGKITRDEINILEDSALQERYGEEIPVLLIDGRMHSYWNIDPERLNKALRKVLS